MTSTDLIVPGDDSKYLVLSTTQDELTDLIQSNLTPGETITVGKLPRVKTPAGGSTTWEVPTIAGEESRKELRGVILKHTPRRTYWKTSFEQAKADEDRKPDCWSADGITGQGEPGGACQACPLNEFPEDGTAKPCAESRQIFLLPEDSLLPYVINVKAGSLSNIKEYFFGLFSARLKPQMIETVITLEKAQSKQNITYSRLVFRTGERLSPEASAQVAAYSELIAPSMHRATAEEVAEDVRSAA